MSPPVAFHSLHLGIRVPPGTIEEAVRAARSADAAIVFVGSSPSTETEGRDRQSLELKGRQNELIEAVLAANPRTVVVLNTGSPRLLPWANEAPAILEGWLAGEEGPDALAQVLFGEVDPSGKLPFTFPRRLEDTPTYLSYPSERDADYGEGVFIGYRYYDKRKIEPLFPFGHGLSYTTFECFQKVSLAPGEMKTVAFTLSPRDLSYYDVHRSAWTSTPGTYRIFIGSSSRDIREQQDFEWTPPAVPPSSGRPRG